MCKIMAFMAGITGLGLPLLLGFRYGLYGDLVMMLVNSTLYLLLKGFKGQGLRLLEFLVCGV